MARGDKQAQAGQDIALTGAKQAQGNASQIYSQLAPTLMGDVAHPAGYNPTQLAGMNTAAQQSAGGSQSAAIGQGGLLAARTGNAGAPQAAISEASRNAGQSLSKAALGIQGEQAERQQQQRDNAIKGLGGLYGTTQGAATGNLGELSNLSNANTNASNASWNWAKYLAAPALDSATSLGVARLKR